MSLTSSLFHQLVSKGVSLYTFRAFHSSQGHSGDAKAQACPSKKPFSAYGSSSPHLSFGTRTIFSDFLFTMVPPNLCLGRNDAGGSLDHKDESMQAFLSFLGVANDSPRRSRRGAYSCHTFGNANQIVKVISEGAFKSNKCILSIHVLAQAFATLATAKFDGGHLTTMA